MEGLVPSVGLLEEGNKDSRHEDFSSLLFELLQDLELKQKAEIAGVNLVSTLKRHSRLTDYYIYHLLEPWTELSACGAPALTCKITNFFYLVNKSSISLL